MRSQPTQLDAGRAFRSGAILFRVHILRFLNYGKRKSYDAKINWRIFLSGFPFRHTICPSVPSISRSFRLPFEPFSARNVNNARRVKWIWPLNFPEICVFVVISSPQRTFRNRRRSAVSSSSPFCSFFLCFYFCVARMRESQSYSLRQCTNWLPNDSRAMLSDHSSAAPSSPSWTHSCSGASVRDMCSAIPSDTWFVYHIPLRYRSIHALARSPLSVISRKIAGITFLPASPVHN